MAVWSTTCLGGLKAAGFLPSSAVTEAGCSWSHTIMRVPYHACTIMHPQIDAHEHIGETETNKISRAVVVKQTLLHKASTRWIKQITQRWEAKQV